MRILWDKDKARINEEKHGVTFEEAAEVLSGDYIEFESNANRSYCNCYSLHNNKEPL